MSVILLSIKPEYSKKIISGEKKFEYRKRLPQKSITKIIIYSSAPEKKVIGEVQVLETMSMSKSELWEITKENAGISYKKFEEYFLNSEQAYAYKLGKVSIYSPKKTLEDLGFKQAPQSFIYLD